MVQPDPHVQIGVELAADRQLWDDYFNLQPTGLARLFFDVIMKSTLLNIAYTVKYLQQNTAAQLIGDIVVAEYRKIVKAAHADTAVQRLNLLQDSNKVSDILLQKLK